MTYQQAGRIAILKELLGGLFLFRHCFPRSSQSLNLCMRTVKSRRDKCGNAGFYPRNDRHDAREYAVSECFWYNSPTPNFQGSLNIGFWLIFILIFVGLAMQDSGARMSRQSRFYVKAWKIS